MTSPPPPLHASRLRTRRVELREILSTDLPQLFLWRNSDTFRYLFHYDESVVDYETFARQFQYDRAVRPHQFAVERTVGLKRDLIGLTFTHSWSAPTRSCFLNVFLGDGLAGRGYGIDTFLLMTRFLLEEVGVATVFVEVFAFNVFSLSCLRGSPLREVARLEKGRSHLGQMHDIVRFAVDRTAEPEVRSLLSRLC